MIGKENSVLHFKKKTPSKIPERIQNVHLKERFTREHFVITLSLFITQPHSHTLSLTFLSLLSPTVKTVCLLHLSFLDLKSKKCFF